MIEVVFGTKFTEFEVHFPPWYFHMGGIIGVLEGNVLYSIGTKNGHFPEILIELGQGPCIPTVGPGTVTNLVAPQRDIGGKGT